MQRLQDFCDVPAGRERRAPEKIIELSDCYDLLYRLGLRATRTSFFHASYALYLAVQQPERLRSPGGRLYAAVAEHYDVTPACVMESLHKTAGDAWHRNRDLLEKLACHPLNRTPRPGDFLEFLTRYFAQEA